MAGQQPVIYALAVTLLTFNSGLAIYQSLADTGFVAFAAVSYLDLVLLFAWRFMCCEEPQLDGSTSGRKGRLLKATIWSLTLVLVLMLVHRVLRVAALPSSVLLMAGAGAGATALGGFCGFLLHRDTWYVNLHQIQFLVLFLI